MGVRPGVPQKSHGRIAQMDLSGRKILMEQEAV